RKLILGGVEIAHPQALEGHSDAYVLLHAICDGILGALGDGDIGRHFPNTDPRYRGISSLVLLQTVAARVVERNLQVNNIDSTIIAEEPRIAPYVSQMAENIAGALKISPGAVNIKATTSQRLGFVGEGRGMAAFAVVLLDSPGKSGPI
ncbi:MAG: 2-C-methyl-D-erythritol 2,4-cyclodiphosphate synthase, partial [Deltaproteobacteria bacterium]|nr:2-C-methyl-D-erythritol 2,4-cyclodiphosphate synthase [Deltaproteobacteria bacterium]